MPEVLPAAHERQAVCVFRLDMNGVTTITLNVDNPLPLTLCKELEYFFNQAGHGRCTINKGDDGKYKLEVSRFSDHC